MNKDDYSLHVYDVVCVCKRVSGMLYCGAGDLPNSHRDELVESFTAWLRSWLWTRVDDELFVHCCHCLHVSR